MDLGQRGQLCPASALEESGTESTGGGASVLSWRQRNATSALALCCRVAKGVDLNVGSKKLRSEVGEPVEDEEDEWECGQQG